MVIVSSLLLCQSSIAARTDKVDRFIRGQMVSRHVPGMSVAVVRNGQIILARGYGLANVELAVPATPDTVYELASVTKQFTATAVMMLVAEGRIGLDDKISRYLDHLPSAWDDVRIRQLLSHASGIKSYTSVPGFAETARKDYTQEEILKLVADAPLDFAPGEKWSYSFGGEDEKGRSYSDTWAWDGKNWTRLATKGPAARIQFAMGYDSARDRIVLFGGVSARPEYLHDVWEFDGIRWTQKQP
jgi:hypothetical protein